MKRQANRRIKGKAKTSRARARTRTEPTRARSKAAGRDPLDAFVDASAHALDLEIDPAWRGTVKANLATTFALAALFADFPLPDDAESAPIFAA
jgi:hypothetical protein